MLRKKLLKLVVKISFKPRIFCQQSVDVGLVCFSNKNRVEAINGLVFRYEETGDIPNEEFIASFIKTVAKNI